MHRLMMARAMIHHVVSSDFPDRKLSTKQPRRENNIMNRDFPAGEALREEHGGLPTSFELFEAPFSDRITWRPGVRPTRFFEFPNLRECLTEEESLEVTLGRIRGEGAEGDCNASIPSTGTAEGSIVLVQRRQYRRCDDQVREEDPASRQ